MLNDQWHRQDDDDDVDNDDDLQLPATTNDISTTCFHFLAYATSQRSTASRLHRFRACVVERVFVCVWITIGRIDRFPRRVGHTQLPAAAASAQEANRIAHTVGVTHLLSNAAVYCYVFFSGWFAGFASQKITANGRNIQRAVMM